MALGGRQSEEPYSGEDIRLLTVVSLQSALTVQTICLSEEMAARIEAERRAEHEVETRQGGAAAASARRRPRPAGVRVRGGVHPGEVGGRRLTTTSSNWGAGASRSSSPTSPARASRRRCSWPTCRRRCAASTRAGPTIRRKLLERANRLFFASTPGNRYATLFLAEFDRATRGLRYVNCGHVPPVLVRAGGAVETLDPTGTVIGLFEDWFGDSAVTALEPGDTLVVCSDGVTEALSDDEEEYGEDRFRDAVAAHRSLPVPEMLAAVQTEVQQFAGAVQSDDLTLLVARATVPSEPVAAGENATRGHGNGGDGGTDLATRGR